MVGRKGASSGAKPKTGKTSAANTKSRPKKGPAALSSKETEDGRGQKRTISPEERKRQQRVLDVFRHAFSEVLSSPSFTDTLQSVKQALYDRDFARAFGNPEYLEVYAARWSPTRALCYASVLERIRDHLQSLSCPAPNNTVQNQEVHQNGGDEGEPLAHDPLTPRQLNIFSIGGGAAELVALGAFLSHQPSSSSSSYPPLSGAITLLDSGPWEAVVTKLTEALTTPPPISKYASEAAKLANAAMVPPSRFAASVLRQDAFALDRSSLPAVLGAAPLLVTLLFTLNELFTAGGLRRTTTLLLNLTAAVPVGSLLLVVDSPGSYSEAAVGKEAKRYPMHWLLDRVLLATRDEPVGGRRWAKLESHESLWFRLAGEQGGGLDYPIALENMRYQMHLYRAEDANQDEDEEKEEGDGDKNDD
ncbi:hypothetical protein L209DRAFT_27331 [Thermothelomyces heterothallicus CBS 203.75]